MRRGIVAAWILAVLTGVTAGCDDGPPPGPVVPPPPSWTPESEREAQELAEHLDALPPTAGAPISVRLAFGTRADLDLYVTGPLEETVYYANTPSGIGGSLEVDQRCVHEPPRVETVRFPAPLLPGRYRVGVDYPHACGDERSPAAFALRVQEPSGGHTLKGLARLRVFEPVVLEFEVAE